MSKDKPAVVATILLCAGTCAARYSNVSWITWTGLALFEFGTALIVLYRNRRQSNRGLVASFSFLLFLFFASAAHYAASVELSGSSDIRRYLDSAQPFRLECEVADEPRVKDGRTVTLVHVRSIIVEDESLHVEGDAILTIVRDVRSGEKAKEFRYGDRLSFEGVLNAPIESRNPGEFSYRDYLSLNGIYATIHVLGYARVEVIASETPSWIFANLIFPSKHFVLRVINDAMHADAANFMIGLLLGDRTDMSQDIKSAFVNTGTIHVLAVSGSHVVLVVAIIYTLFSLVRLPEKAKLCATVVGILYYMELTGATPSVVRASLMAIVVLVAKLFQQRSSVYNSLGVSAVLLLTYDPLQMFDAGFQLSYSAVLSMVYFYPKLSVLIKMIPESLEELKAIDYVLKLFALSLAAQIGTIPFTAYFFGRVSAISLVANLVVVPLVEVIVTIGFVAVLAGICSMWLSSCICEVNNVLTWFTLKFVVLANSVPHATISTATFGLKETLFYSAFVSSLFSLGDKGKFRRSIIVALAIFDAFFLVSELPLQGQRGQLLRVNFLDVGQGDAALIEFPSGEKILVDAGPKTFTYDAGEKVVGPFLQRRQISALDAIVVSHPHSDHLGGVPYLLRHFNVRQVIDAGQRAQSSLYYDYEGLIPNMREVVVSGMEVAHIANVRLYGLHPVPSFLDLDSTDGYEHLNNTSVVFKLVYGTTSFLFVGDAEIPVEDRMNSVYGTFLHSDVLKSGHHGSITSSSDEFLANVRPNEVVVSVGKFNKFHHPSRQVLERYKELGTHIHRTDEEGAVILESDGTTIRHVNWRKD